VAKDQDVELYFQGSAHSDFLHLNGKASISHDKAKIKELWRPILKTWFTEGVYDPRITVIRFAQWKATTGHQTRKHGRRDQDDGRRGARKTLDDSIEGKLACNHGCGPARRVAARGVSLPTGGLSVRSAGLGVPAHGLSTPTLGLSLPTVD
jgi:hypothetical protein